jgi:hypothetical protein
MKNLRLHHEKYACDQSSSNTFDVIESVCRSLEHKGLLDGELVTLITNNKPELFLELYVYTKMEFLDVMQIKIMKGSSMQTEDCIVDLISWSSGFCPTSVPLAPLFSVVFFWVPFAGKNSSGWTNSRRVQCLKEKILAMNLSLAYI